MKFLIYNIFAIGFFSHALSQVENPCAYGQVLKQLEKQMPGYLQYYNAQYKSLVNSISDNNKNKKIVLGDSIFQIPVVFHVLYNNNAENVHDSLLISQLQVLNQDYMRLNADTTKTRAIFKSRAGSVRFQFHFATKDPNGNATNGIVRKFTSANTLYDINLSDYMKYNNTGGDDAWNPGEYLNIWVCDISINGTTDNVLGYAFPPYGHPNWSGSSWVDDARQGVVIHYKVIGRNNPLAKGTIAASNKGRVATHEVGHFFGLRHIWADDDFLPNKCSEDDFIDDTPLQGVRSNFNCNLGQNTCNSGSPDEPDMVENYMDYSSEACQNMFTKKQIGLMRATLYNYRYTLPDRINIIATDSFYDAINVYADGKNIITELTKELSKINLTVSVFDMSGQIVNKKTTINNYVKKTVSLGLRPGMYIVTITDQKNKKIFKTKIILY